MILLAIAAVVAVQATSDTWTPYDEADSNLNAVYRVLSAHLIGPAKVTLRDRQRQWIADRNAACGREAHNACAIRLTQRRTSELTATLEREDQYRSWDVRRLLVLEDAAEDGCHSGGQDPDGALCRRRDTIVTVLRSKGWCYGSRIRGAYGYQMKWLPCSQDRTQP